MNINRSKSTKGYPCPSRELPTHQVYNVSNLGIAILHLGLWKMKPIKTNVKEVLSFKETHTVSFHNWIFFFNFYIFLKTDRQRVGLDGFRHLAGLIYRRGTNKNLARPLQHPLLPGNLHETKFR